MFCELWHTIQREVLLTAYALGLYYSKMCVCVRARCRFKSALYKLAATLYKFLFFLFEIFLVAYSWKKNPCDRNSYKIHGGQTWLWWLKETTWVYYYALSISSLETSPFWIWRIYAFYVTAGMCSIMPFCYRISTYYQSYASFPLRTIINI